MKIVIDARIIGSSTGVYAENLVNHLQKIDTKNEYVVLVRKDGVWRPRAKNFRVLTVPINDYTFGEQLQLAAVLYSLKPDLVHFCMPNQPLLYFGKRVTTVHDLTLVRYENIDMNPLAYRLRKLIFTSLLHNVVWRSKAVLVPTAYVKKDVLSFSSQNHEGKIIRTYEAGDPLAARAEVVESLKNKPFLFFIGNAFPYKNLNLLLDAYLLAKQSRPELELVFAGKKEFFYEQLEGRVNREGIADVHFLGYVSEGEKRWLLQNARAYVVASLSEGFHIPGLEAMYEGCPVISSTASCLPEVNGDAALYFDPYSAASLKEAIEQLLSDENLRKELISAGHKQVKNYSWKRMAQQTKAVYDSVLDKTM